MGERGTKKYPSQKGYKTMASRASMPESSLAASVDLREKVAALGPERPAKEKKLRLGHRKDSHEWSSTKMAAITQTCPEREELLFMAAQTKSHFWRGLFLSMADFASWYYCLKEPKRQGVLAEIVQSKRFEFLVSFVIVLNAAVVLHTTNHQMDNWSTGDDDSVNTIVDACFLVFYTVEIALKLAVHKLYLFHGRDKGWNAFDFVLVVGALLVKAITSITGNKTGDASGLRAARVLKLTRVLRVVKLLRIFTDLRLLMRSIIVSVTSLFWAFALLGFCFYLNGLVLVQGMADYLSDHGDSLSESTRDGIMENFGSVQRTMMSFFKAGTNGQDWNTYFILVTETGVINSFLFVLFMGFIHISLLNILTAFFVDQFFRHAQPDKEALALQEQKKIRKEADQIKVLLYEMDEDKSGTINKEEFKQHMEDARFRTCLSMLGLDVRDAQSFFEILFEQGGTNEVGIDSFVEGAMRMRGQATGIDQHTLIMDLRFLRMSERSHFNATKARFDNIEQRLLAMEADTATM